jgi:hypothetical protein
MSGFRKDINIMALGQRAVRQHAVTPFTYSRPALIQGVKRHTRRRDRSAFARLEKFGNFGRSYAIDSYTPMAYMAGRHAG